MANFGSTTRKITIGNDIGTGGRIFADSVADVELDHWFLGAIVVGSMGDFTTVQNVATSVGGDLTVAGDYAGTIHLGFVQGGDFNIQGNLTGHMIFERRFPGTIVIGGNIGPSGSLEFRSTDALSSLPGSVEIVGDLSGSVSAKTMGQNGRILVDGNVTSPGRIEITGQTTPSVVAGNLTQNAQIRVLGDVTNTADPPIHVYGSIVDGTSPDASRAMIVIGDAETDELSGTVAIDGGIANAYSSGPEITVTALAALGAVAINYDGVSENEDDWGSGATVEVGENSYDGTDGNNATDRVWNVYVCKGDMNGDRDLTTADGNPAGPTGPFYTADDAAATYRDDFPGLEGSRIWHGDCNFDGNYDADLGSDAAAFAARLAEDCCTFELEHLNPGDVDGDLDVDLSDLATLLANFGLSPGALRSQGDLDGDGDIDLSDLARLLANFGASGCEGIMPPPLPLDPDAHITVGGYDSGYYSSGDFKGEADDWIFDVFVELDDEDNDWFAASVKATTANGATFRIVGGAANPPVPGSGLPNRYRCFFSVPYAVADTDRYDAPLSGGGLKGSYNPLSGTHVYSSGELNANWYDFNATSDDGPAAIMRIVIDIGAVSSHAASTFGDVYFTSGSPGSGDIKVADFTIAVYHLGGDGTPTTLTGAFFAVD